MVIHTQSSLDPPRLPGPIYPTMGPSDDLASLSFKESDLITYRSALLVNLFMPNMVKPVDKYLYRFLLAKGFSCNSKKQGQPELESNLGQMRLTYRLFVFMGLLVATTMALRAARGVSKASSNMVLAARKSTVRPSLDDIDRISRGQAAKKRGTGSRAVPHRLNEKERIEFDLAKKRKFVSLRGTGWRAERGDSPLANIYRNYCDAVNQPCISVRRGIFINEDENVLGDEVIVDFSPLRKKEVQEEAVLVRSFAEGYSSVQEITDNSDLLQLGFEEAELPLLEEDVIWRLPVYSVSATFLERAESKAFAEKIANEKFKGTLI